MITTPMNQKLRCPTVEIPESVPNFRKKVQVGKDQEKTQSEKDSYSKNRDGKKTKLTIKYSYHENIS